jgi:hypothetical protein
MSQYTPKQSYKNRSEAFRLFIAPQNLPVSQAKFYTDAVRLDMVLPDKTIQLAALLSYAKDELKVSTTSGQSLVDRSRDEERLKNDDRKGKAEADLKEMQAEEARRKLDEKWLYSDDAWAAVAGLMGTLWDNLLHHFHAGSPHLVHLAGGEPQRSAEVYEGAEEILAKAFNEVTAAGRIEAIFEVDPEATAHEDR